MTTSNREQISIGTLAVNDGVNFEVESLTFNPAQKKPQFASNAAADGEALVKESHYTMASFDLLIRVVPQTTADAAREKLGELSDAVQACERVAGGQATPWIPHDSEDLYTAYATTGDITEVPMEVPGDNAGWFLKAPLAKVHLTCRPFLETEWRVAKAAVESGAEPLQIVYVGGIKGDVQAEARLILKDTATQDRRFGAWGRDVVFAETGLPAVLLPASTSLTVAGFSGESKTRTGAYGSEKVFRGSAVLQPTTLCGTGRIQNVGSYALYARVYATSAAASFRISYRNGDGPLIPLEWKQPAIVNGWAELFMGEVIFDQVQLGAQTSEVRFEQRSTEGTSANDVNYLILWPATKGSGKARGVVNFTPTALVGYDPFPGSGALAGKVATPGGAWSGAGDADDFTESSGVLQRTAVSDVEGTPRYAYLGTTKFTDVTVQAEIGFANVQAEYNVLKESAYGVMARYKNIENWLALTLWHYKVGTVSGYHIYFLHLTKRVAGTRHSIAAELRRPRNGSELTEAVLAIPAGGTGSMQLRLDIFATGLFRVSAGGQTLLTGIDTDLSPTGALNEGFVGLFDEHADSTALTRRYDAFEAFKLEPLARACYSGRQLEFNPRGALRQDSTGTYDGPPSIYRGAKLFLEPALDLGLINRIATRLRRNDDELEEDAAVTDKHTAEVLVKERFLLPR